MAVGVGGDGEAGCAHNGRGEIPAAYDVVIDGVGGDGDGLLERVGAIFFGPRARRGGEGGRA